MHYTNSASFFTSSSPTPIPYEWDPETVFGLVNSYKGVVTCVGYAPSQGRRCRTAIAAGTVSSGRYKLNKLAAGDVSKAAVSPELEVVADMLLCWRHNSRCSTGSQAPGIAREWRAKLENLVADIEAKAATSGGRAQSHLERATSKRQNSVKSEAEDKNEFSMDNLSKMMKQMEVNLARLQAEMDRRSANGTARSRDTREKECQENIKRAEAQRRAREENERKKREEEGRKIRDQKQREEDERRQEQERQRKEQQAREEAFRERVRLAQQKREREARDKLAKGAADWRAAWERYSDAWDSTDITQGNIPWPVRSGLQSDVSEANVRLFFTKAPPEPLTDSVMKRLKLTNSENKRWHTDKVMQRFGPDIVNGAAKSALDIIAKVMVELRQEAQRGR